MWIFRFGWPRNGSIVSDYILELSDKSSSSFKDSFTSKFTWALYVYADFHSNQIFYFNEKSNYFLRILYNVFWSYLIFKLFWDLCHLPYPPKFVPSFIFPSTCKDLFVLFKYTWIYRLQLKHGWITRGYILKGLWFFLSKQPCMVNR